MADAGTVSLDVELGSASDLQSQILDALASIEGTVAVSTEASGVTDEVNAALDAVEGTVVAEVQADTSAIPAEIEAAAAEATPDAVEIPVSTPGADEAASSLDNVTNSAGDLQGAAEGAVGSLGGLGGAAGGAAGQLGFAGTAAAATIGAFIELGAAAGETQQVNAELDRVLASTGDTIGVTGDHVRNLATDIMNYSGISDEAIVSGASMVAMFTNVRNTARAPIFDQVIEDAADVSRKFGTDFTTAALQLGRAFNDPVNGVNRLRRVLPSLTKAQADEIAAMAESGDLLGAQVLLHQRIEEAVDGAARAYGNTLPGEVDKTKESLGELAETIGTPLLPEMTAMVTNVNELAQALGRLDVGSALAGVIRFATPLGQAGNALEGLREQFNAPEWTQGPLIPALDLLDNSSGHVVEGVGTLTGSLAEMAGSTDEVAGSATEAADAVSQLTEDISDYLSETFDVPDAQRDLRQSFADLTDSMTTGTWDDQAVAMEGIVRSTAAVIDKQQQQGYSQRQLDATVFTSIATLAQMRDQGRITGAQFDTLSAQILAVPREARVPVSAPGADDAIAKLRTVKTTVDGIPRSVQVQVSVPNLGAIAADVAGAARALRSLESATPESAGGTLVAVASVSTVRSAAVQRSTIPGLGQAVTTEGHSRRRHRGGSLPTIYAQTEVGDFRLTDRAVEQIVEALDDYDGAMS